jgi:signal transduction histidine kinase
MRRELRTRDAFLARFSEGLSARVKALTETPGAEAIAGLQGFARELAMIAGNREAMIPRREPLDVGLHVQQILDDWQRENAARAAAGPAIHVECSGERMASVDGDHVGIIFAELASNAYKYGRGRPIRVLIEGEPDRVRIVIEDQGAGFVPTRGLGKRFVRGPGTERVGGFGVGLWLTTALAEAHGGALRFALRSGGGTRAIVTLLREGR